jgi:hypothetical protein
MEGAVGGERPGAAAQQIEAVARQLVEHRTRPDAGQGPSCSFSAMRGGVIDDLEFAAGHQHIGDDRGQDVADALIGPERGQFEDEALRAGRWKICVSAA